MSRDYDEHPVTDEPDLTRTTRANLARPNARDTHTVTVNGAAAHAAAQDEAEHGYYAARYGLDAPDAREARRYE